MTIDLRSDTVTRPGAAMRRAIADAEVGDDVLDGDPTTRRLEARVAELLGKEDALFCPSGTMANQVALWLLGERGTEVLLDALGAAFAVGARLGRLVVVDVDGCGAHAAWPPGRSCGMGSLRPEHSGGTPD